MIESICGEADLARRVGMREAAEKAAAMPAACGCGAPLDTATCKPGRIPTTCGRCYQREYQRRRRARLRAAQEGASHE